MGIIMGILSIVYIFRAGEHNVVKTKRWASMRAFDPAFCSSQYAGHSQYQMEQRYRLRRIPTKRFRSNTTIVILPMAGT